MTVEAPDHYGGKPIPDDAIEIALAAEKKKKDGGRENEEEVSSLADFIYVPSVDLYFAKERTLLDYNWYNTHRELQSKGLKMPTIPEFVEFLKYLRADPTAENTKVYKEIIEKRDPRRVEWLDAKFIEEDGALKIQYHIFDDNRRLVPHKEDLEGCVMEDCYVSLDFNNQGLPTKKSKSQEYKQGENIYFWHPRENKVAWFYANFDWTSLNCSRDPDISYSNLGVFTCAKNAGGKQ